ncbi:unnamed protein product [Paramecium sonneborni]|uniref:ubiquitinyl hydrolase 1 n=1 Tax=Paramecium sonneborni TaxID=65129 RepID=A0A8S1RCK5_9CILI|nr:unnamed protein product [Paramecium sonneborni]
MSEIPDHILTLYKEMGFGEFHIRQCWVISNCNDGQQFQANLFGENHNSQPPPQPQHKIPQPPSLPPPQQQGENQQQFFARLFGSIPYFKAQLRKKDQIVGIQNIGNTCTINSMLQLFHSIPQIYNLLIECDNTSTNCYGKFVYEIQTLFTELTASNLEYIYPKTAVKSLSFGSDDKEYIGVQQDIVEIFNLILTKFDQCIRRLHQKHLMESIKYKVELFGHQELNQLFQIIFVNETGKNEYHAYLNATLKHQNTTKFLLSEFKNKIIHLPKFLRISVNRIQFQKNNSFKSKEIFLIDEDLNLDMCLKNNQNQNQQEVDKLQNTVNQLQNEINKQAKRLDSLRYVINLYEKENIFIDLINILKIKQKQLEQQLLQLESKCSQQKQKINNLQNQNRYQYKIHSIVIHFGSAYEGHNYIYIYNFHFGKWMIFNDNTVQFVNKQEVEKDSKINAQVVIYVDSQVIPKLIEHYKYIQTVGNIIVSNPDKNLKQIEELNKIPQNILELLTEKNKRNYQSQLKQFQ